MLYDVQVWKLPGVDTDTVTSSKRYALERAATLRTFSRYRRVVVVDRHGRPVVEGHGMA
jgi:hypothetical protein